MLNQLGILNRQILLYAFATSMLASTAILHADTINVPTDQPTIQDAIDAIPPGTTDNTIILAPGTYVENLHFSGKIVMIQSTDPTDPGVVAATIIDGNADGPVVLFDSGETRNAGLDGLTMTNGRTSLGGGGIRIINASPTIRRCIIDSNVATSSSGGGLLIRESQSNPLITECTISDNQCINGTVTGGGGIAIINAARADVIGNWLYDNGGPFGGAIRLNAGCGLKLTNNIIYNNNASIGGGALYTLSNTGVAIRNNTIANNVGGGTALKGGIWAPSGGISVKNSILWGNGDDLDGVTATYSNIEDGNSGTGNISQDPLFIGGGDYHIQTDSPCANAGDPATTVDANEKDIDGSDRVMNGQIDMGADEVDLSAGFALSVSANPESNTQVVVTPADADGASNGVTPFERLYTDGTLVNLTIPPVDQTFFVRWTIDGVAQPLGQGTIQVNMNNVHTATAHFVPGGSILVDAAGGGDYTFIQPAIDAAVDGDVIVVKPGLYPERVNFLGKAITVQSLDPQDDNVVDATMIDGGAGGHVVTFNSGETATTILKGMTIRNGLASGGSNCDSDSLPDPTTVPCGGGIYAFTNADTFTSPVIQRCVIHGNHANNRGGGVFFKFGAAQLIRCRVHGNTASSGAGISTADISGNTQHNPVLEGNTIMNNDASAQGGGVYLTRQAAAVLRSNVIADNEANQGGGVYVLTQSNRPKVIKYCTIANNGTGGIFQSGSSGLENNSNILWGNGDDLNGASAIYSNIEDADDGEGNISLNPRFVDPGAGIYNILPDSPCIDAGMPGLFVLPTEKDIDAQARVWNLRLDMGADEVMTESDSYVLWFTSTPSSGAGIDFDVMDVDGLGGGITPFFRSFLAAGNPPIVTATADALSPAGAFYRWVLDENPRPVGNADLAVLMSEPHRARAEYLPILRVQSNLQDVAIAVDTADVNAEQNGDTDFDRIYPSDTVVELTAPIAIDDDDFAVWQLDGVDQGDSLTLSVTMDGPHTATAMYGTVTHILTINAQTPGAAYPVEIDVNTQDINGVDDGQAPPAFSRTYYQGVKVTLTAPVSVCTSAFLHWQLDGVDQPAGNRTIEVTIADSDLVATAVYADAGDEDCNDNGVGDICDVGSGNSFDCNNNEIPDECESDCNTNGIADECDIEADSKDCNTNGVPDECEPDCNVNNIADECDILDGTSIDCNTNGVPDECDIAALTSDDCDGNNQPDDCQLDGDGDGAIDECDGCPNNAAKIVAPCGFGGGGGDDGGDISSLTDFDEDGVEDDVDNCPNIANADQVDFDGDDIGDSCDTDTDGDGIDNTGDECPETPLDEPAGSDGCSESQSPVIAVPDNENENLNDNENLNQNGTNENSGPGQEMPNENGTDNTNTNVNENGLDDMDAHALCGQLDICGLGGSSLVLMILFLGLMKVHQQRRYRP